jgi:ferric-dicitrate binding protein FerR (iron transport regulator)
MEHTLERHSPARQRHAEAPDTLIRLAARVTLVRQLRAGACVAVQSGRVWLTQTGDANDYFIEAGQRHVVADAGRVVIEGDSASTTLRVMARAATARPGFP